MGDEIHVAEIPARRRLVHGGDELLPFDRERRVCAFDANRPFNKQIFATNKF
jgi:hypothetical protein